MPSVVQLVTTNNFAGVERYVSSAATELVRRGWDVTVVGGHPPQMRAALADDVSWLPGATPIEALRSVAKLGRQNVCHAHMTIAETVAIAARPVHRAALVSTRHFAARRGSSGAGRALAPLISAKLDRQIAVTEYVAGRIEHRPDAVIRNGILPSPYLWRESNRVVLVLQRLEHEKDTGTALRAWCESRMFEEGWSLRIVGDGTERRELEGWATARRVPSVTFAGWTSDVRSELARSGILLAPAPSDSFGFAVLEAMSAGVPVVAAAAGGHLETVGRSPEAALFAPADASAAAEKLRALLPDSARAAASSAGRKLIEAEFTIERHVDRLLPEYEAAVQARRRRPREPTSGKGLSELVVCSLEPWDDVWRRNQFFVDILLRRNPELRILFVEPPADPLFDLTERRAPTLPRIRVISADRRLRALRPLKLLPRRMGLIADAVLRLQVVASARLLGFSRPTLWINDVTYSPLLAATGWPSVYDVTDDWLDAPFHPRELERLRRLDEVALEKADEVVVCSRALAARRGTQRDVTVVENGVDVEHFRRPRPRPEDLPEPPVAVYVGSLHESRLDVDLVVRLARAQPQLNVVLVGPSSLTDTAKKRLAMPNVLLLGSRPYRDVPGYLQHADVVIIPHRVSRFTDSLDPIKAYECLVVDTPTVATEACGFRELDGELNIASRELFPTRVAEVLADAKPITHRMRPAGWDQRAAAFEHALRRARNRGGTRFTR